MTSTNCLNCGKELTGKYCAGCGQKTDTHRISFKNFIFHDELHGTFHIEKGMLFTAKEALIRPGKAALDYIAGKRIRYYNVFYFILLAIGLMLFVRHLNGMILDHAGVIVKEKVYINEASKKLDELFAQKSKIILLLFVPFAAINSFILFKRKKLNLSEHAIIAGMIFLGLLLLAIFSNFIFIVNLVMHLDTTILSLTVTAMMNIYVGFGYYNTFAVDYTKLGIAYRIFLFFVMISIEILVLILILIGIASNWKFGQITIAPFS